MIRDFFKIALQKERYRSESYVRKMQVVYEYIKKFWHLSVTELASSSFDLEECFTLLESQADEALQKHDTKEYNRLQLIQFLLKSFFAEVLSEFEVFTYSSDIMRKLGMLLYKEKPIILTFNYDCFLEAAIEAASGLNPSLPKEMYEPIPDKWPHERITVSNAELGCSHFNWNRPLAYGIIFNEVQLQRAGLSTYVEGNRFYSHPPNKLYYWPILKLHGSLNWFRYLPIRKYPMFTNGEPQQLDAKENAIILVNGHWWFGEPPDLEGWIIDPIIITPILYKEKFCRQSIFEYLWERAKHALSKCERLVIIGYSFPPTDFSTRRLFRESFCEHDVQDLVVVNPNSAVAETAKDLCHFEETALTYKNLDEFLASYHNSYFRPQEPT
jgi:hypothetical protein